MKNKRGVSQSGSEKKRELKRYYINSNHQHRMKMEWALLDVILENENILFNAAIILSAAEDSSL